MRIKSRIYRKGYTLVLFAVKFGVKVGGRGEKLEK